MIREPFSLEEINTILRKYTKDNVEISPHYQKYLNEGKREISVNEILNFLFEKRCYFVEKQINSWIRYKMVYELSNKYDLVIVVKEEKAKILKVVSAYKSDKRVKEKWKKISESRMMK